MNVPNPQSIPAKPKRLSVLLDRYAQADDRLAVWQLVNTVIPYLALWAVMIIMVRQGYAYGYVLALSVLSALFLVRIFIFVHDAGHQSFFSSKRANDIAGNILSIATFTPFAEWRESHNIHHATAGNLDRRGVGDVWTMTVEEYQQSSKMSRFTYRFLRHPIILFVFGPLVKFVLLQRFPRKSASAKATRSVWVMNVIFVILHVLAYFTIGLRTFLIIQLPVLYIAGLMGIWLFYVQHQFDGVYWARDAVWDRDRAALDGCSYYRLPAVLQWFSGNIGFHHIHHARSKIPNYNLARCYRDVAEVQNVKTFGLFRSLRCVRANLYDEASGRMLSFHQAMKPAER